MPRVRCGYKAAFTALHKILYKYINIYNNIENCRWVPESVCPGLPLSEGLSRTSGISGLSHVGHWVLH